jgi:hypothetical protein
LANPDIAVFLLESLRLGDVQRLGVSCKAIQGAVQSSGDPRIVHILRWLKEIEVLYCYYQKDPAACRKISQSIKNHPDRSRIVETEYVYEVTKSLREAHTNFWEGGMSGVPLWELDPEDVVNRWERDYCHGIEEHFRDCLRYPADSFDYVVAQMASAPKKAPKKKKAKKKQRLYCALLLRPARNTECSRL